MIVKRVKTNGTTEDYKAVGAYPSIVFGKDSTHIIIKNIQYSSIGLHLWSRGKWKIPKTSKRRCLFFIGNDHTFRENIQAIKVST